VLELGLKGRRGDEGKERRDGIEGRPIGGEEKMKINQLKYINHIQSLGSRSKFERGTKSQIKPIKDKLCFLLAIPH
jgi:hypothetical protein